jgi:hypothetical protein
MRLHVDSGLKDIGEGSPDGSCPLCRTSFDCPTCSPAKRRSCACTHMVQAAKQCARKAPVKKWSPSRRRRP